MKKLILLLFFTISLLIGAQKGSASLFVFFNGEPYTGMDVNIDGKVTYKTDAKGLVKVYLDAGRHEAKIMQDGIPLAYFKFNVTAGESTQAIITLKEKGKSAKVDVEEPGGVKQESSVERMEKMKNLPKGYLLGTVLSSEKKEPVEKVKIYVKGFPVDATTDKKGIFNLELPEGNYSLSVIHPNYSTQTVENVVITAKETTNRTIEVTPAGLELAEFVVLAPHIEGSVAALVDEQKKSDVIADIVGSEQMSKRGDSNAAAALKRVSGLTIIGGKSIYVRGLGDRYASVELNNMPLPSPNPLKRVVPLDVFPAGVIGSMQVQKTFSPDIPGTFGGGYINIRTRNIPDEDYVKVTIGSEMHSSYGESVSTYKGGSSDWTGFDDYRKMDSSLVSFAKIKEGSSIASIGSLTPAEQQAMIDTIKKREMKPQQTTVPLGKSVSVELSRNYDYGEHEFGVLFNYAYKTKSKAVDYNKYRYEIANSKTGELEDTPTSESVVHLYRDSIEHGGMLNLSYKLGDLKTKYTKFYVHNTTNTMRVNEGTFGENSVKKREYYLDWDERTINLDQLIGEYNYALHYDMKLDFGVESAIAEQYQPGNIEYDYYYNNSLDDYVFSLPNSQLNSEYVTSNDTLNSFYLKNKMMFPVSSDKDYLEIGYTQESKEREADIARYRLDPSNTFNDPAGSSDIDTLLGTTDQTLFLNSTEKDQYDAKLQRHGSYLKAFLKPIESLEISGGMRNVEYKQILSRYDVVDNIVVKDDRTFDISKELPSLGIKYNFNESNQLRFAYYKSFITPDIREFVPTTFKHPDQVALISGNEDLIETDILSYDIRYEYYFDKIDNISFAYFVKNLDNPIEDTQEFSSSGLTKYTFENSKSATMNGFELSWLKKMDFIHSSLEPLSISGNYTSIESQVVLTEDQKDRFVTQSRGLQGLSPQILNLSFRYEEEDGRSLNLSYNKMSERLMKVAIKNGNTIVGQDDYEVPADILDFVWIEKIKLDLFENDLAFKLKYGNILNGETVWKQEDKTTYSYKAGSTVSASLSLKY